MAVATTARLRPGARRRSRRAMARCLAPAVAPADVSWGKTIPRQARSARRDERGIELGSIGGCSSLTPSVGVLLYDSRVSGNCYKVRLLLAHLGIPYERREVSVVDRSNRPDLLGGLNPALRVPTIVFDDGRSLGESGAILWYFGERTRFVPEDRYRRAEVVPWVFF